jgi:hypothetical protein
MSARDPIVPGFDYEAGAPRELPLSAWRERTAKLRRFVHEGETFYFDGPRLVAEVYRNIPAHKEGTR